MNSSTNFSGKAWVAVGNLENWEKGLENGIWGIVPALEHHWKRVGRNDLILLYCMAPIKRFFGAGILRNKFRQTSPLWREEIEEKRVKWPYRFEFDVIHLIPLEKWENLGIPNADFNFAVLGGLNPVQDFSKALRLLEALTSTSIGQVRSPSMDITSSLYEMGKIQRMVVESRYPVEKYFLDVIWKRTIRSVPTYAFSVNLKERLEDSLYPLKHAYDRWNSRPFLITDPIRLEEAKEMTSGLYHEFSSVLKILSRNQVEDLYHSKKTYYDLEEKYGLR